MFKIDKQLEMKTGIVWDTSKAYFRGIAMRYAAKQRRKQKTMKKNLKVKLEREEAQKDPSNKKTKKFLNPT